MPQPIATYFHSTSTILAQAFPACFIATYALVFYFFYHKQIAKLYAYCDNAPFVISEKALCEISRAGLKGIICAEEIETVRFQRKTKKERVIPKYFHIELARSCITINHQKSKIVYGNQSGIACPLCRQIPATYDFCRSLSFCMDFFEGYDIFQIYELGETVFLSQKFVDFYRNSTLSNLHFTPAEKYGAWEASYFLDGNEDA